MKDLIRLYGDPVLRVAASKVTEFDGTLRSIAERLLAAQSRADAVGVAAPQIGVEKCIMSLNVGAVKRRGKTEVLVNPELVSNDGEVIEEEGCLSFPDIFVDVVRPRWVAIKAFDLEGNPVVREGKGMLARAYLHEIDHLQGRLIIDRVTPDVRARILRKLRSAKRAS